MRGAICPLCTDWRYSVLHALIVSAHASCQASIWLCSSLGVMLADASIKMIFRYSRLLKEAICTCPSQTSPSQTPAQRRTCRGESQPHADLASQRRSCAASTRQFDRREPPDLSKCWNGKLDVPGFVIWLWPLPASSSSTNQVHVFFLGPWATFKMDPFYMVCILTVDFGNWRRCCRQVSLSTEAAKASPGVCPFETQILEKT